MKNLVTKAIILHVLACSACLSPIIGDFQEAFGAGLNTETSFNLRITREKFAKFHSTLIIPEENIKIDLEEVYFSNFDFLTGDLVYDEIFSMRSPKFEPDISKKQGEKTYAKNTSMPENINIINLSGSKIASNNKPFLVSSSNEFQQKIKKAARMVTTEANFFQVRQLLSELEKTAGNNTLNLSNLAKLYMKTGNPEKACELLKHAEKIAPNNYKIIYTYAICLYKKNNLDLAEQKLKEVASIKPDFMYAYYNLGNVYYKGKNYNKALGAFKKAMSLSPGFTDIYFNIALTLEQLNYKEFAKKFYQKCLETNPKDRGALRALERMN